MENNDTVFAKGFFWKRPSESAPSFVKGKMGVKVEEAVAFLQENKKSDGFVNLDLLQSKDGTKLYFKLDTFTPNAGKEGGDDSI